MKVKRMGIKEIFSRIWVISANKIKTSESISKESSQLKLNSSLRQIFAARDGSPLKCDKLLYSKSFRV